MCVKMKLLDVLLLDLTPNYSFNTQQNTQIQHNHQANIGIWHRTLRLH